MKLEAEADQQSMPDRKAVIPQAQVIPVALSRDLQVANHPPVALRGGEIALPYLDTSNSNNGDTLRATQRVITRLNPGLLPSKYRQFHKL